jgi:hypothetical protein
MLEPRELSGPVSEEADRLLGPTITFTHPDDVLQSGSLSAAEKRAILASWASDAHAVPNLPAMRQLESGAIVSVDTVLGALRALDASAGPSVPPGPHARPRPSLMSRWRRPLRRQGDGDDGGDDPPPCPASALPPGLEIELRRRRDAAWQLVAA